MTEAERELVISVTELILGWVDAPPDLKTRLANLLQIVKEESGVIRDQDMKPVRWTGNNILD